MSMNSSKRTGKDHRTKPAIQSQLARLKREEEEELWISGEELCTEGSSDEEDSKTPSRIYKTNKNQNSRNSLAGGKHHWVVSNNKKDSSSGRRNDSFPLSDRVDSSKLMNSNSEDTSVSSLEVANSLIAESQNMRSSNSVQSETNISTITDDTFSDVAQEEEEGGQRLKDSEISWKVNRGTIKLINAGANATTEHDRP